MKNIILVFIGGGFGSILRYIFTKLAIIVKIHPHFATFTVNILGCFILGALYIVLIDKIENPALKLALMVGFCGGFTTFSTFSFEIFEFLKNGKILLAILYALISLILGLICFYLGATIFKGA